MASGDDLHRVQLERVLAGEADLLVARVARHPSESAAGFYARLLAWGLVGGERTRWRAGVCRGDEPALWEEDASGRLVHWIEVGKPSGERLARAARRAPRLSWLATCSPHEARRRLASLPERADPWVRVLEPAPWKTLPDPPPRRVAWELELRGAELRLRQEGVRLTAVLEDPGQPR